MNLLSLMPGFKIPKPEPGPAPVRDALAAKLDALVKLAPPHVMSAGMLAVQLARAMPESVARQVATGMIAAADELRVIMDKEP